MTAADASSPARFADRTFLISMTSQASRYPWELGALHEFPLDRRPISL